MISFERKVFGDGQILPCLDNKPVHLYTQIDWLFNNLVLDPKVVEVEKGVKRFCLSMDALINCLDLDVPGHEALNYLEIVKSYGFATANIVDLFLQKERQRLPSGAFVDYRGVGVVSPLARINKPIFEVRFSKEQFSGFSGSFMLGSDFLNDPFKAGKQSDFNLARSLLDIVQLTQKVGLP